MFFKTKRERASGFRTLSWCKLPYTAFLPSWVHDSRQINDSTLFLVHFSSGLCFCNKSLTIEIALWFAFPQRHVSNVNIHLFFHMSLLPPIELIATVTVSLSLSEVIISSNCITSSWLSTSISFSTFSFNFFTIDTFLFFCLFAKIRQNSINYFPLKVNLLSYLCLLYFIIFMLPHTTTTTITTNHIKNHPTIFRYAIYHGLLKNTILSSGNTL